MQVAQVPNTLKFSAKSEFEITMHILSTHGLQADLHGSECENGVTKGF